MKKKNLRSAILSISVLASLLCCGLEVEAVAKSQDIKANLNNQGKQIDKQVSNSKPIRDKWAVVIGIDNFQDKSIPQLRFSAKDAKDFAQFLVEEGNFASDHVKLILNEEATENNIRNVLGDKWLPRRAMPDDLIIIFVSSHGSPKELDRRGANYLVAHDTFKDQLYTSGIKLEDLGPDIQDRTQCNRVVLLLDACNSGAAKVGGKGLYRKKNFDLDEISQKAGIGLVVISSSSQDQRSWESKRYKNSVFTRNLIDTLKDPELGVKIDSVYQGLKNKVEQEVKFDRQVMQTPIMRSKWEGVPLKITVKPAQPRNVVASADEVLISKQQKIKQDNKIKNSIVAKVNTTSTSRPSVEHTTSNTTAFSGTSTNNQKTALLPGLNTEFTKVIPNTNTNTETNTETETETATAGTPINSDSQMAIISVTTSNRFILNSNKHQRRRRARKAINKETTSTLPKVLRDQIAIQLNLKTGKTVVAHDLTDSQVGKVFGNQKPNFYFPQRNQMKALSKALNARYLVMAQITQMKISEKPSLGPMASIQITTKVIDGKTGWQKAVLKQGFIKPHSKQRIDKRTILQFALPKLASDAASDIASKL